MPVYTITAVGDQVRDWDATKGGPMKSYRVTLRNAEGNELANVEWARKATSPKPEVGQSVDGDVDTSGQYGPKLKLAQQQQGGRGGGGGGRSPEESRRIVRQHSQNMALKYAALRLEDGDLPPRFSFDTLKAAIDFFHKDAMEGGQS